MMAYLAVIFFRLAENIKYMSSLSGRKSLPNPGEVANIGDFIINIIKQFAAFMPNILINRVDIVNLDNIIITFYL
jgi:hypothetical protein